MKISDLRTGWSFDFPVEVYEQNRDSEHVWMGEYYDTPSDLIWQGDFRDLPESKVYEREIEKMRLSDNTLTVYVVKNSDETNAKDHLTAKAM